VFGTFFFVVIMLRWGGCARYGNSCTPWTRSGAHFDAGYKSFAA
jgi:hypothetical protein